MTALYDEEVSQLTVHCDDPYPVTRQEAWQEAKRESHFQSDFPFASTSTSTLPASAVAVAVTDDEPGGPSVGSSNINLNVNGENNTGPPSIAIRRQSSLHLSSITDDEFRAILDPNDSSTGFDSLSEWSEDRLDALLDLIEPQHLSGLIQKSVERNLGEKRTSLSFRNIYYERDGIMRLQSVTGFVKPGMLVGVLGAPDAGVTSLFEVLTGRANSGSDHVSGELLLDRRPPDKNFNRHVGYVVKEDPNLATLTVMETLYFSAKLRLPPLPPKLIRFRVKVVMKMLGLLHTANTVVGDGTLRGISGGEKRRVSYACEIVAGHSIILADLPTNGLDSASAFSLMRGVKFANRAGRCMMASVVQPSPELFDLFDYVLLLSKGCVMYFGPTGQIEPFLESCGFVREKPKSLPDYLEALSATPERFWKFRSRIREPAVTFQQPDLMPDRKRTLATSTAAKLSDKTVTVEEEGEDGHIQLEMAVGGKANVEKATQSERATAWEHLVKSYKHSEQYRDVGLELFHTLEPQVKFSRKAEEKPSRYHSTIWDQMYECFLRQVKITYRNRGYWQGNMMKSLFIGFIVGTLFISLGFHQKDVRTRFGLFFFMLSFVTSGAVQMVPQLLNQRTVYYNQVQAGYFNGIAFFLSLTLVNIPMTMIEVFLFQIIVYPASGLQGTTFASGQFWYMFVLLVVQAMTAKAWVGFLAAISPSPTVAGVLAPVTNVLFIVFCGFLNPKNAIPIGWQWMYTISYYTYAIRGLAINEHRTISSFICDGPPDVQCVSNGQMALQIYNMDGSDSEIWTDLANVVYFFIAFTSAGAVAFLTVNFSGQEESEAPNFTMEGQKRLEACRSAEVILNPSERESTLRAIAPPHAYLQFSDLSYSVMVPAKDKKDGTEERVLLTKTFGFAKPGAMCALMGPSGAGKSTLLDVLANKKTGGKITGNILINGKPRDSSFSRIAAYVEQFDSHSPMSTVREAVEFSARLRLPESVSESEIQKKVDEVLFVLGISHLADERIGSKDEGGVMPEVRKKVTIAVELVMNPSLLFLDEPTTGLDGAGAYAVMSAVRDLAQNISVICTIHQPSAEIFEFFSNILIVKSFGEVAYFGPVTELSSSGQRIPTLANYFSDRLLGELCPPEKNVADYALDCIKQSSGGKNIKGEKVNVAQLYLESELYRNQVKPVMDHGIVPDDEIGHTPHFDQEYAAGFRKQFYYLFYRFFESSLRDRPFMMARLLTPVVMAFVIGTLFFQMGRSMSDEANRISIMFLSLLYMCYSASSNLHILIDARPIYFREKNSNMYRPTAYFAARALAELPFIVAEVLVYCTIVYWIAGLSDEDEGGRYGLFLLVFFGARLAAIAFAELLGTALEMQEGAEGVFGAWMTIFMLFSGFLISKGNIPNGWIWMYYLSFLRYPLAFLTANELRTEQFGTQLGQSILDQFSISSGTSDLATNLGVTFVFAAGFRILAYIAHLKINHIKR